MRFVYDNSADNPRNPAQPPARVYWGQQSQEEMGDLWLQLQTRNDQDRNTLSSAVESRMIAADVVGYEQLIHRDPARSALHDDVAVLYLELGRPEEALRHFNATAKLKPDSPAAHFNLATTFAQLGRLDEAIAGYRAALQLRPDYALAHNNLAGALVQSNHAQEAVAEYREALRIDPKLVEARLSLGNFFRLNGQYVEAMSEMREAVRSKPDSVAAVTSLASLLATASDSSIRDPEEAVRLAEHSTALTFRQDVTALDVLAAAYASAGDFDKALKVAEEALALNPPASLASGILLRRDLYRQHRPYISPKISNALR
jgi:tetratricopeptide (TPR) repeat protein